MFEGIDKVFKNVIQVGDVFLNEFENIDHKKYIVVLGISEDKESFCFLCINSTIHPSIFKKQFQLDLQIPIKRENNSFLRYDSFANCVSVYPMDIKTFTDNLAKNTSKVIGKIDDESISIIRNAVINSGLQTRVFLKKFSFVE